jgi:peptide/nickel transport system substrate-binding protein
VDRIPLPDAPGRLAFGGGALWAATGIGRTVVRIEPATGRITQTIRLGIEPADVAFSHGELWVADPGDRALLRIDARSGIVRRTIELPARPSAVAIDHDAVWVASHDDGSVLHIDVRSNAVVDSVDVGQGPSALIASRDAVWAANSLDGTVSRIDPRSGNVVATVPTGSGPAGVTATGSKVWVANRYSRTVSQLDATTNAVVRTVRVQGQPAALASAAGKVWVGLRDSVEHRGGTLVLLFSRRYLSIDPQVDYERPPAQYLGLAYDGLVAWNHTEGADGLQLVPDLAIKLPLPADRGRTYRFRLRPGIRYSDGRAVKASDFARAMVRLPHVHSPAVPHFAALERTGGVVVDDRAGTVVFHLSEPDPEFLLKLASGLLVPIPAGTPMHDVGDKPLLGTGPYRIADVSARRIRFVRNPRFHEWSRAAQPEGSADVIEWRFGLDPAAQVRAIAAGRADWSDEPPPELATIARLRGGTLHSKAFPVTSFIQINTRRPPFYDVRARRALNYAVDRARIAREFGGPLAATPTCQVLPPGVAGYRPYCPYTRGATRAGKWRAPDMRRARALVAASGTRGARVTLWTADDDGGAEPGTLYMAGLLGRLGYRARLQRISSTGMARASRALRARMQLVPVTFGPDYPSADAFFSTFIACDGPFTWDQFCDRGVDREIQHARRLGTANAHAAGGAWAALDRKLVDRAIWLPLVNLRIVDFISKRVHGYQNSPIYHFLPAQAWIQK